MITIGMMMIKACPNQIYQEKEDEVDLMFADIEPEDEWQDKVLPNLMEIVPICERIFIGAEYVNYLIKLCKHFECVLLT